jgi:hypothetical protein
MTQANPLQHYFRTEKIYISLPSGTAYYTPDVIEFNEAGEVGVMPMTAKDEVIAKNPDALLNGDAIAQLITSCVPAVKNPKELLANDIDALMIAMRHATYGDDIEVSVACPSCGHTNSFDINITQSLATMGKLDAEYKMDLKSGVVIYVKPFSYKDTIKALRAQFEQLKVARSMADDKMSDENRMAIYSKSYSEIADLNTELLTHCVIKIVIPETNVEVTEQPFILEFLNNQDRKTFNALDELIRDINDIGVEKNFDAKCEKCESVWKATIDFNPVNFFTES